MCASIRFESHLYGTTHSEISGALHTTPCGGAPHKESWRRQTAGEASKTTHTPKRHATPAPAHPTPPRFDLLRAACAPTSTHSNGFCAIWVCISSSSSSIHTRQFRHPLRRVSLEPEVRRHTASQRFISRSKNDASCTHRRWIMFVINPKNQAIACDRVHSSFADGGVLQPTWFSSEPASNPHGP